MSDHIDSDSPPRWQLAPLLPAILAQSAPQASSRAVDKGRAFAADRAGVRRGARLGGQDGGQEIGR
jgi:hypothetical protein